MKTIKVDFNARTADDNIRLTTTGARASVEASGAIPNQWVWITDGEVRALAQILDIPEGLVARVLWDTVSESDQERVAHWVRETMDEATLMNKRERCLRFIEEALELVQALDFEKEDVLKMVEYVYNRPRGEPNQELGGAMVTALALAECVKLDAYDELHRELDRIFAKQDEVRAKHQQKIDGGFTG